MPYHAWTFCNLDNFQRLSLLEFSIQSLINQVKPPLTISLSLYTGEEVKRSEQFEGLLTSIHTQCLAKKIVFKLTESRKALTEFQHYHAICTELCWPKDTWVVFSHADALSSPDRISCLSELVEQESGKHKDLSVLSIDKSVIRLNYSSELYRDQCQIKNWDDLANDLENHRFHAKVEETFDDLMTFMVAIHRIKHFFACTPPLVWGHPLADMAFVSIMHSKNHQAVKLDSKDPCPLYFDRRWNLHEKSYKEEKLSWAKQRRLSFSPSFKSPVLFLLRVELYTSVTFIESGTSAFTSLIHDMEYLLFRNYVNAVRKTKVADVANFLLEWMSTGKMKEKVPVKAKHEAELLAKRFIVVFRLVYGPLGLKEKI